MSNAALTRPYVLAGEELQPYAPDWQPAAPGQDEEATGDPAAPDDEDQGAATLVAARVPSWTTEVAARAVGRVPIAEEPTVVARAYRPRHTPEAVTLARRSGEVLRGLYHSDPTPPLAATWDPAAPLHRRPTRPGRFARLIGQVRRLLA